jgi:Fic family protein
MTDARTYERTHPWLTFSLNVERAPASLWILLGECQSKCEHVAGIPLKPGVQQRLQQVYLAKGALATNAIEGNTLTQEQVQEHLEGRLRLPPSQEYLKVEVVNIISECNRILHAVKEGTLPELTVGAAEDMNRAVLANLSLYPGVVPGEVRRYEVSVARYKGAPSVDCGFLLERLCSWLNSDAFSGPESMELVYAILKAIVAHLYVAWIHPFGDGNGRTARLMEFQILIASGVPAPAAHLLSNHYNKTRSEYYRQLDEASRSGAGPLRFIHYAVQGFRDGLREQIEEIRRQQIDVAWTDYVHEKFRSKNSQSDIRRRHLVLDLSGRVDLSQLPAWVRVAELPALSKRLAEAYAGRTGKTLSRDVNALVQMELLERSKQGVRARKEIIMAFLPARAAS